MKNQLRIHSVTEGDVRVDFSPDVEEEVNEAQEAFDNSLAEGFFAYVVDPVTKENLAVREFDPNADLTIVHGPMAGG